MKYKKLNKDFAKKNTRKEETIILDDASNSNSLSSSEAHNSNDEDKKTSITYDSQSGYNDESSSITGKAQRKKLTMDGPWGRSEQIEIIHLRAQNTRG